MARIAKSEIEFRALRAVSNAALSSDGLPSRLKILDWGVNKSTQGDVILDEFSADNIAKSQPANGRARVPLDFEHQSVECSPTYKADPIDVAAYGTVNCVRGDGLYLDDLKWTPAGEAMAKNYEDLSPAVALTDGRVTFVHSAALTKAGAVEGLTFFSSGGMDKWVEKLSSLELEKPETFTLPPLTTREQVVTALMFIGEPRNIKTLTAPQRESAQKILVTAAKKYGVPIKPLFSVTDLPAYAPAAPFLAPVTALSEANMNAHMAQMKKNLNLPDETPDDKVLEAMNAEYDKVAKKGDELNRKTPNMSTDNFGMGEAYKRMTADLTKGIEEAMKPLNAKVEALNLELERKSKEADKQQRDFIIAQATKEGKVIPLSASAVEKLDVTTLSEMVQNLPKTVPITRRSATRDGAQPVKSVYSQVQEKLRRGTVALSSSSMTGRDKAVTLFNQQVEAQMAINPALAGRTFKTN
jgi:hypothetical protein